MSEIKELIYGQVDDYEKTEYDEPVLDAIDKMAERYPDHPALIYLGKTWTYSAMMDLMNRFATALHQLGIGHGDKVMIYIPNCPQFIFAFFGIQRIGAVPVPVSPIYTPHEIEYLINDSGAEAILCMDTNVGYVKEVFPRTPLKIIIVTNFSDLLPLWKRAVGMLFNRIPRGMVEKGEEVHFFKDLIDKCPPDPPEVNTDPRRDLSRLLYTGGTTGFPKGVPTNHTGVVSYVREFTEFSKGHIRDGGEDRVIMVAPLFHEMAQLVTLSYALSRGNALVILPIPEIDAILDSIQRHKVTLFIGVPALYRMILEHDRRDLYDLSSLRHCLCGADKLPPEVAVRWKETFDVPIHQGYGATEVGLTSVPEFRDRTPDPQAIGVLLPSREVLIVDSETLEPVPEGEVGECLIRCEHTFKHYWNKPEETANSFVPVNGRLFYRTNDYVKMGEDKQLYFIDRGTDIIKHKGYRVSASEIEATLQDHEAVIAACAVGVPDPKAGERIKAIVVLKEDVRGVSSTDLLAWCRGRLAAYKVPRYIEFRDMLPKSKVGKLLRREIRDEERRKSEKKKAKK